MIRLRARTQGLAGYLWDGMAADPETFQARVVRGIVTQAKKVNDTLPAPRTARCTQCGAFLSKFTAEMYDRCTPCRWFGGK